MKREVTDHDIAQHLANKHPKSKALRARHTYGPYVQMPPNGPSTGAAPGAGGPPTTGAPFGAPGAPGSL